MDLGIKALWFSIGWFSASIAFYLLAEYLTPSKLDAESATSSTTSLTLPNAEYRIEE